MVRGPRSFTSLTCAPFRCGPPWAPGHGELLALLGPSGCGKTTTLRMIVGLENPGVGSIRLRGISITGWRPERRDIALVCQDYALFPHLMVEENVRFVARFLGRANLLAGEAHGSVVHTPLGPLPLTSSVHGAILVAVRPEQIRLVSDPRGQALVKLREFRGHDQLYRVRVGDTALMVISPSRHPLRQGQRVRLEIAEPVVPLPA